MQLPEIDAATVVERMFDPSDPYLYIITLPALIMAAMGARGIAVGYATGATAFVVLFSA